MRLAAFVGSATLLTALCTAPLIFAEDPAPGTAQPSESDSPAGEEPGADQVAEIAKFESSLDKQHGKIALGKGLAKLDLGSSYAYLGPADTDRVVQAWGNPPSPDTLGMLFLDSTSLFDDAGWAVIITYSEDGHVEDDDAEDIDFDELLEEMQTDTKESNAARKSQGFPTAELIGWAEPPHYDAQAHKLYWAKELAFEGGDSRTLNYSIRALGRKGVLELNAVAPMNQLALVKRAMPEVLGFVDFERGHQYADFDPDVDSVAAYGIGALVAGKLAAKVGLFKGLLVLLLASKKLVIAGVIGLGVAAKSFLTRKKT